MCELREEPRDVQANFERVTWNDVQHLDKPDDANFERVTWNDIDSLLTDTQEISLL